MKILITGCAGQLGRELKRTLAGIGTVVACDRSQLDLADRDALRSQISAIAPDVIVNAAAYTAVDKAETDTGTAYAVNATAPGIMAEWAAAQGALLIHYSTDYVFDGLKPVPYLESDLTAPRSVYGQSKLAGEQAITASGARHLIFRTSWVYGLHGANFMKTMLRLARKANAEGTALRVIGDQFGAPTWTRHLADATLAAILTTSTRERGQGIYHLAAAGETTWHAYAEAIFEEAVKVGHLDKIPPVHRIATADFPLPAPRPANSRLDCALAARELGLQLPDWRSGLADCLADTRF